MKSIDRRWFIKSMAAIPVALAFGPGRSQAADCKVQHPLVPPDSRYSGQCPVCGMLRPMWARTWITFDAVEKVSQVCSFHCLADWTLKSGRQPAHVMLTVYHQPERAVAAEQASIVIGSVAAGTMSPTSKIVFADRAEADAFALNCGGDVVDYPEALHAAQAGVSKENQTINARRLEKGKIVEPGANDSCPVCAMVPQRYPYGKCQIKTTDERTIHFCSTQCLFAFLGKPEAYLDAPVDPLLIWVVDRTSGMWISGRAAFYVLGSKKVFGPMGYEALPFNARAEAEAFAAESGGRTALFGEITVQKVVPGWQYPPKP
jgi:nitrous oxide reductase accessory protein NosL